MALVVRPPLITVPSRNIPRFQFLQPPAQEPYPGHAIHRKCSVMSATTKSVGRSSEHRWHRSPCPATDVSVTSFSSLAKDQPLIRNQGYSSTAKLRLLSGKFSSSASGRQEGPTAPIDDSGGNSSLVGSALSRVLELFLQTQLESCDHLSISLRGSNRELLSGRVASVRLTARKAVFKGLTLTSVELQAEDIAVDVKNQAARGSVLCHRFPVSVQAQVSEADMNSSLQSPIIFSPVLEFFGLHRTSPTPKSLRVKFRNSGTLEVYVKGKDPLQVKPKLCPRGRRLKLEKKEGLVLQEVDLGTDTEISLLSVTEDRMNVHGTFLVIP
eukprot:TRINITY_DN78961_c0_g1_i1.p1 TRINITY_DN78961_c0_g1~~TRINITY_DN78961_c0_g1_i1.p1  ORF type:complete len:326 (+),score=2.89 TRINITY_DN78961_c0_g1_i1:71-1048(+)